MSIQRPLFWWVIGLVKRVQSGVIDDLDKIDPADELTMAAGCGTVLQSFI